MRITITSQDIQRMSEMSATDRVYFLETKFIEQRQSFWLQLKPGIEKIQQEMITNA